MNELELNNNYQEILKLDKMLTEKKVPHELLRRFDGWQIFYPSGIYVEVSVIEYCGSFGKESDLLEILGLLTPEELKNDSVLGHLTAENVFERILKHWNFIN